MSQYNKVDELSPCVNVCVLEYGVCKGCRRTQNEIATWRWLSEDEKEDILLRIIMEETVDESDYSW